MHLPNQEVSNYIQVKHTLKSVISFQSLTWYWVSESVLHRGQRQQNWIWRTIPPLSTPACITWSLVWTLLVDSSTFPSRSCSGRRYWWEKILSLVLQLVRFWCTKVPTTNQKRTDLIIGCSGQLFHLPRALLLLHIHHMFPQGLSRGVTNLPHQNGWRLCSGGIFCIYAHKG